MLDPLSNRFDKLVLELPSNENKLDLERLRLSSKNSIFFSATCTRFTKLLLLSAFWCPQLSPPLFHFEAK